jgi:hypothetical protein
MVPGHAKHIAQDPQKLNVTVDIDIKERAV